MDERDRRAERGKEGVTQEVTLVEVYAALRDIWSQMINKVTGI